MRSGELLIYKGDFVDVDPNVRYSIEDFDEKEYFLFRAGENIHDRNDAKSMFGMAMELLVEGYNLVKVKYDFRMNGAISVMSDDKKEVKFIDSADKIAIIGKDKIKPYLNKSVKIYYVVRKEEMQRRNNDLYVYMHDIFGADVIELFDMKFKKEEK